MNTTKYIVDHDFHFHSMLSLCSSDPEQNPEHLLQYAIENGYRQICLTNHFWDELVEKNNTSWFAGWYDQQNYAHVSQSLPLPQAPGVEFLFGVEAEMTMDMVVGVSPQRYDAFDFIVIPISHFHQVGFTISQEEAATPEGVATKFLDKLEAVLNQPLPYHKVGLAHLVSAKLCDDAVYCRVVRLITGERLQRLFAKAAELGVGIELNVDTFLFKSQEEEEAVLNLYRLAKQCGCKFYFATDAHHPSELVGRKAAAERIVDLLELTEDDKFRLKR